MRVGLWVSCGAALATAPRLTLAVLVADGVDVPGGVRSMLLTASALATCLVLATGQAYLAHQAAARVGARRLLVPAWLGLLVCTAVVQAPLAVVHLDVSTMGAVLSTPGLRWAYALALVLAVDLTAAGTWAAVATGSQELSPRAGSVAQLRAEPAQPRTEPGSSSPARLAQPVAGAQLQCRNGCGQLFGSRPAEAGHQRACPLRGPTPLRVVGGAG